MIVVLLVLGLCIGAILTWIVNWATLANMERDRSLAVSNLAALATKVEEAQEIARNSKKAIDIEERVTTVIECALNATRREA